MRPFVSLLFVGSILLHSAAYAQFNFYEVDQGKLFRSAQMNERSLEETVKTHGIKTIINLRGENKNTPWYQQESAVAARTGTQMIDIAMGSETLPSRENLLKLLAAFKDAPRPILVHCQAGADRTGEAVALYEIIYMEKSKQEALKSLSFKYMHLAFKKPAKTYFIKDVWQGVEWAETQYRPCEGQYKYYNVNNAECKNPL